MSTQRDIEETNAATSLSQNLRTSVADFLEQHAEHIEQSSTDRHIELLQDDEDTLHVIRSISDQHEAIVCRIAKEIKNPRSSIDDYRNFGKAFAAKAIERNISLRDTINGLLFLKSEMMRGLSDNGFLDDTTGMEVKALIDFIGTRIDVLFAELAISFHQNFTDRLNKELAISEQYNQQKNLFIRIASHEIRNPLTGALSICELSALQDSSFTRNEHIQEIHSNLLSINRHLNQLLDMSFLEDDKITLHKKNVNVSEMLNNFKLSFERVTKDHEVTLKVSSSLSIETDPDRFEQIIMNLLQNAAKYSPAGSTIELSLQHDNQQMDISVTDQGRGIKTQDFERIFKPYERLIEDKTKDINEVEGLGLGLYICRTLAAALGGTLGVQSTLGKGSTFTLTLPLHS